MAGKDADAKEKGSGDSGGRKKMILLAVPVVLAVAVAGWFFLRPGEGSDELPPPVAGPVVQLDPITINLAGGHFLKLGLALQTIDGAHSEPSGAKALDLAISQFSGKTIEELSSTGGRTKAKAELTARIKLAYLPHDAHVEEEGSEEETHSGKKGADPEGGESHDGEEGSGGHHDDATLTAAEAIEKAGNLTVHPDVYEVYFTEFVMQ